MNNIPNAEASPRVVNGVLLWYEYDTFDLQVEIDLTDQDGEKVNIGPEDTVRVVFLDRSLDVVKEFEFTDIQDNIVTLDFDAACSALFPKGSYTYDVYYKYADRTTICKNNKVVVE